MSRPCLCGAEKQYSDCCQRFLTGQQVAISPEQLMRSRYSAFVEGDEAYLLQTWQPSTRPDNISFDQATQWLGLDVEAAGLSSEDEGWVRFSARYKLDGTVHRLHETSRFRRQAGCWFYLDGVHHPSRQPSQPGRNQACPCDSGKKYKRCCGR